MFIVLLLFFKSVCLYCQRLVLHIHDRWINPKNVRLLKEAAEAKGSKFQIEEYYQTKRTKKRRCVTSSSTSGLSVLSPLSNSLADVDSCRFCANSPQGYCRHHFHLQELHVQKQQRQQKFWCPLSGVVGGANRSTDYRQLRKIKRDLKRNIQQQQELKLAKTATILYEHSTQTNNYHTTPPSSITSAPHQLNSENSSCVINDSGYQTISMNTSSSLESEKHTNLEQQQPQLETGSSAAPAAANPSLNYVDIKLPSPTKSYAETTYSFETCCETPNRSSSPTPSRKTSTTFHSFVSCEYSTLSTSYL